MVDKILDQPIDRITMWELLGLSPDLLAEIWGVCRFPSFNKAAIPATQATDMGAEAMAVPAEITKDKGKGKARLEGHTSGLPRGRRPAGGLRVLYACASPTVMGKIKGKLRVKMLIHSGSEMNVMSKGLWERAQDLLPIDIDVSWFIGSANSTHDKVYGVCDSVMVDIGGVEIEVPVFVWEEASQ